MFSIFSSEKIDIETRLNNIAIDIYNSFGFDEKTILYNLSNQKSIDISYGKEKDNKHFSVVIGIKEYVDANAIHEKQLIHFQNTLVHEFVHADTWVHTPETLKQAFRVNRLSYSYWAYKLLDEYRAYSKANEKYQQSKQTLKSSEEQILKVFEHYCSRLQDTNIPAENFADSYYDLATSFIVHKFLNPDFPSIQDSNYIQFVNTYLDHIEQAVNRNLLNYKEYEQLGEQLLEDFSLLFPCIAGIHTNKSFKYFLTNSHMK